MKRLKASVLGRDGTMGVELSRLLSTHPEVELAQGPDRCDVVLLAGPRESARSVVPAGARIVDVAGALDPGELDVRGAPELDRAAIRSARAVGLPGGFATAIALGLAPLARAKMLSGTTQVVGIGPAAHGAPDRVPSISPRGPLQHRDAPTIEEILRRAGAQHLLLRFVALESALERGIVTTSFVEVSDRESEATVAELYRAFYANEPFVRVVAPGLPSRTTSKPSCTSVAGLATCKEGRLTGADISNTFAALESVVGSNVAEIGFALGEQFSGTRTLVVFCALDDLGKGGAGQAIQCMNLMLGLPETAGL